MKTCETPEKPVEQAVVLIPTFRRPEGVVRAVQSALRQSVEGVEVSVLVVDNDAAQTARPVCEGVERVHYTVEPRAGVSNARNTGLDTVSRAYPDARWVFFLDDDMRAEPGCLAALVRVARGVEAGVAFAAVRAVMPDDSAVSAAMQPFFSRRNDEPQGLTRELLGVGGSLFDLSRLALPTPPFDPACNETGGEDDVLLAHLQRAGAVFAWVPSAHTLEDVPASRATLAYLWRRNLAFGQGPTQIAADHAAAAGTLGKRLGVVKWMVVGAVQIALRLPWWGLTKLVRSPAHASAHARLAQGVGKLFWWEGFRPRFYGEASQSATVPATVAAPVAASAPLDVAAE